MTARRAPRLIAEGAVPAYQRALAALALVITSPLLAIGAIAVRVTSPGPTLFRQERVGIAGRPITVLKLRTMRADSLSTSTATTISDDRITTVGRWLRRFKIDELPQLWCVIRGDMAIIGPRPDVPEVINALPDEQRRRFLTQRPGVTGLATLYFRDEATLLDGVDDPDAFSAGPLIGAKAILNDAYATRSTWRDDARVLALTVYKQPDAVAELARQLAPGYAESAPFQAIFEQGHRDPNRAQARPQTSADDKTP